MFHFQDKMQIRLSNSDLGYSVDLEGTILQWDPRDWEGGPHGTGQFSLSSNATSLSSDSLVATFLICQQVVRHSSLR